MSDVRRVIVDSTKEILEEASGFMLEAEGTDFIVDDPGGTHALLPWEEYTRLLDAIRIFELGWPEDDAPEEEYERMQRVAEEFGSTWGHLTDQQRGHFAEVSPFARKSHNAELESVDEPCETCGGSGKVASPPSAFGVDPPTELCPDCGAVWK
ncbi:MAG TPA: hypothetical protein VMW79_07995 [Anaerolineae bacterium]|nr:hypothetical protein [Anaerolineae bacterium]